MAKISRRDFLATISSINLAHLAGCSGSPAPQTASSLQTELHYSSAAALAENILQKRVSSVEVVSAFLNRIAAVNPKLNSVFQIQHDQALENARTADAQLARGERQGPLHGVPMTIKDSFDTAGVISTAGTTGRVGFIPSQDATIVARLRGAGAILLGKTNTPELTLAAETDNLVYGRTNNPYNLSRSPGGSSGGAAALLAAGGTPFDLGSDTGGSIRMPAHFCGIAAIKPTAGRVPRTGHIVNLNNGLLEPLTQVGPLARYVEDLAIVLPIIAGSDWIDPASAFPPPSFPAIDLKKLRVAFFDNNTVAVPTADIRQVIRSVALDLEEHVSVVEEKLPDPIIIIVDLIHLASRSDGDAELNRMLNEVGTSRRSKYAQPSPATTKWLTAPELDEFMMQWSLYRSRMFAFLRNFDAIVCPVYPSTAPEHGFSDHFDFATQGSYVTPFNWTGWPSAVVRAGTSSDGLPIGVQIVGHPWREDIVLAVAAVVERKFGGWRPPLIPSS